MAKIHNEEATGLRQRKGIITEFFDRHFVGKNDPNEFSEKWQKKFNTHPSWCDADMCLQQINAGNATGNKIALYERAFFQRLLYLMGCSVQRNPMTFFIGGLLVFLTCCIGLQNVTIETDIVKLWVSQGGRLDVELNYLARIREEYHHVQKRSANATNAPKPVNATKKSPQSSAPEIPSGNGLGGGFQVIIQTPEVKGTNLLNKEGLLRHVSIMEEVANYKVEMYGESWSLADICFKPPSPKLPPGSLNGAVETLLERIIPCIWITPIDCFWEGSKPLGPSPPLVLGDEIGAFISSLPKGNITWKNLDPGKVVKEVSSLLDLGLVENFFERAGIGSAYLNRPCINPLDPDCPPDAPNHFNRCKAIKKFMVWNDALPDNERVTLTEEVETKAGAQPQLDLISDILGRKKRQANPPARNSTRKSKHGGDGEDYYAYEDDKDYESGVKTAAPKEDPNSQVCKKFGKSFLQWMDANPNKWKMFLTEQDFPVYPDYANRVTGGCLGFGKNIMKWPEDLIIGGVNRDARQQVVNASAFQSVFLVAGPTDVYHRFKHTKSGLKPNLDQRSFTIGKANAIIQAWQRNFTQNIYKHKANTQAQRVFHPLASTSIGDMLEEFSQFNFTTIILGYILMIIYAALTQFDWDGWWLSPKACCGAAIVGVFIITFSSIAGLGLSAFFGVHFNAATTNIVPFISLGLGIDDMFLVLHSYTGVLENVKVNEIGVLMKETGMSILITSINIVLAFVAGTILPIPALRSFCAQAAILLAFNMVANLIVFPAFITMDLKRRKANRRDLACCCFDKTGKKSELKQEESTNELVKNVSIASDAANMVQFANKEETGSTKEELKLYTLDGFLKLFYIPLLKRPATKITVLIICSSMFIFGCAGLYRSKLGLELADVLPEHTAPAAFLKAREEYFSFYPMFLVPNGPLIDYPNQQQKLEDLRKEIAKSDFVIKVNGGPSEPYWLQLMRLWLNSIQKDLDKGLKEGLIDPVNGNFKMDDRKVTDDMRLARRLICSYGIKFNCTGRIGIVKLVDGDEIINPEGFYNYLTGWYNVDNMMYYVSQAAFFPTPPGWAFNPKEDGLIPPAPQLLYSQIPMYLTGLTDTPVIVEMIKEVRAICDKYTEDGLSVFPTGIAFTFWEQYLLLTWYLFLAIVTIATAVLVVISLIVFNPWVAAMVAIVVLSMTIELAGFMGLVGVKLNPISAVTLITAVGIGVEFTAHVVLAFLTALGTRNDRMVSCMEHMFVPVLHGCLSTLLGIIMLAFSEFEFIVIYFFVVMTALIVIGMINGLALFPVLLSLIGPPCEVVPIDGGNYLECPTSNAKIGEKMMLEESFILSVNEKSKENNASSSTESSSSSEDEHNYHDILSTIDEEQHSDSAKEDHKKEKSEPIQRF